jgi:cardiolipin synthase
MNIPNILTILRILSIPLLIILLSEGLYYGALILFAGAALTDALDGFLARTLRQKTVLGAYLDPIADKLLLSSAFVTCAILKLIPVWLAVLVISRDVIISLGILVLIVNSFAIEIRPTVISKCTTLAQIVTIGAVIFLNVIEKKVVLVQPVFWAAGILTILSGIDYVNKGLQIINERDHTLRE